MRRLRPTLPPFGTVLLNSVLKLFLRSSLRCAQDHQELLQLAGASLEAHTAAIRDTTVNKSLSIPCNVHVQSHQELLQLADASLVAHAVAIRDAIAACQSAQQQSAASLVRI